jgi:hypothetical protein
MWSTTSAQTTRSNASAESGSGGRVTSWASHLTPSPPSLALARESMASEKSTPTTVAPPGGQPQGVPPGPAAYVDDVEPRDVPEQPVDERLLHGDQRILLRVVDLGPAVVSFPRR